MQKIILALPKGRILHELKPFLKKIDIDVEEDFFDENSRKLIFSTNIHNLEVVKVRSVDVANIVKFQGADIGVCGKDVIEEFLSPEFYSVLDLGIGKCRLSLAHLKDINFNINSNKQIRVATKYPNITQNYFNNLGIQVELIKLNGAIEIATKLKLCDYIVDLVSSGKTLAENQMIENLKILDVSSHLIVNRTSLKTKNPQLHQIINKFNV